jgi:hypothetical protein
MSDKNEIERLRISINRAAELVENQLNTPRERREGDGDNYLRYALDSLRECVAHEKEEDKRNHNADPSTMTNKELVDRFASTYQIHSNPSIYRNLKAGYDEILARLERGKK